MEQFVGAVHGYSTMIWSICPIPWGSFSIHVPNLCTVWVFSTPYQTIPLPKPKTKHPTPQTRNLKTLNLKTVNPKPYTPQPSSLNPKGPKQFAANPPKSPPTEAPFSRRCLASSAPNLSWLLGLILGPS